MSRKTRRNLRDQAITAGVATRGPFRSKAVLAALAAAAAALVIGVVLQLRGGGDDPAGDPARRQALASEHAPTLGEADARVHIVEFLDPACETCAAFYPRVKQLLAAYPGRIRLSIRHLPFHDGADVVVRALEASRAQDRYWQALEAVLAAQSRWTLHHRVLPDQVWPVLAAAGIDLGRLRADMESPEVAARMSRDFADAKTVKVTATPEYFVNGRPLPGFGWQQFEDLVKDELRRNY